MRKISKKIILKTELTYLSNPLSIYIFLIPSIFVKHILLTYHIILYYH